MTPLSGREQESSNSVLQAPSPHPIKSRYQLDPSGPYWYTSGSYQQVRPNFYIGLLSQSLSPRTLFGWLIDWLFGFFTSLPVFLLLNDDNYDQWPVLKLRKWPSAKPRFFGILNYYLHFVHHHLGIGDFVIAFCCSNSAYCVNVSFTPMSLMSVVYWMSPWVFSRQQSWLKLIVFKITCTALPRAFFKTNSKSKFQ